ncbi:MAG: HNH endonuclease [Verrucomicrobiales bacterium]|nr:HNH endonuclease [Verrucomicrobiales bacterium]
MSDVLTKATVLVLNRNWQAINVKTPQDAFGMLATDTATGLDISDDGTMVPVRWSDWVLLPVRDSDNAVKTVRGAIRVPTVMVLSNFAKVPKKRPKFGSRGIWERDGGVCQYTGRKLAPGEGNIDHVVPRSRGGKSTWENCVLAHKDVNSRKANRLPEEAGLKLLRKPAVPREVPVSVLIKNQHRIKDWELFLTE